MRGRRRRRVKGLCMHDMDGSTERESHGPPTMPPPAAAPVCPPARNKTHNLLAACTSREASCWASPTAARSREASPPRPPLPAGLSAAGPPAPPPRERCPPVRSRSRAAPSWRLPRRCSAQSCCCLCCRRSHPLPAQDRATARRARPTAGHRSPAGAPLPPPETVPPPHPRPAPLQSLRCCTPSAGQQPRAGSSWSDRSTSGWCRPHRWQAHPPGPLKAACRPRCWQPQQPSAHAAPSYRPRTALVLLLCPTPTPTHLIQQRIEVSRHDPRGAAAAQADAVVQPARGEVPTATECGGGSD